MIESMCSIFHSYGFHFIHIGDNVNFKFGGENSVACYFVRDDDGYLLQVFFFFLAFIFLVSVLCFLS